MKFSDKYECRPYYFNPYRNPHYSTWEFPGATNSNHSGGGGQLTNNFGKFRDHHENLETMKNQETIETLLKNLMLSQNSEKNDQIKNEINRRKAKKRNSKLIH